METAAYKVGVIGDSSSPLEGERMSASSQSERRASRGGYGPLTLGHAKHMRKNMQEAERLLWYKINRKQLGVKFRRQQPISNYIVDFVCPEKRLIVELDGFQHQLQQGHDMRRTAFLESLGYTIMRFWNNDVFTAMDAVLEKIAGVLKHDYVLAADNNFSSGSESPPTLQTSPAARFQPLPLKGGA